jgi:hypothetical protein
MLGLLDKMDAIDHHRTSRGSTRVLSDDEAEEGRKGYKTSRGVREGNGQQTKFQNNARESNQKKGD